MLVNLYEALHEDALNFGDKVLYKIKEMWFVLTDPGLRYVVTQD